MSLSEHVMKALIPAIFNEPSILSLSLSLYIYIYARYIVMQCFIYAITPKELINLNFF